MTLRDRIRELANSKGMSLPVLEATLGFGNGTIVRWDRSSPTAEKLQKVADYFNVSIDYLLGRGAEEKVPAQKGEHVQLENTYMRLAHGAQELGLDDEDVDAILALYAKHRKKNE